MPLRIFRKIYAGKWIRHTCRGFRMIITPFSVLSGKVCEGEFSSSSLLLIFFAKSNPSFFLTETGKSQGKEITPPFLWHTTYSRIAAQKKDFFPFSRFYSGANAKFTHPAPFPPPLRQWPPLFTSTQFSAPVKASEGLPKREEDKGSSVQCSWRGPPWEQFCAVIGENGGSVFIILLGKKAAVWRIAVGVKKYWAFLRFFVLDTNVLGFFFEWEIGVFVQIFSFSSSLLRVAALGWRETRSNDSCR